MAYETTEVAVDKSQGQVRGLLIKHGAAGFMFAEELDGDQAWATVTFRAQGLMVRMRVPHKPLDAVAISRKLQRARSKTRPQLEADAREQEARRIWRVLHWSLKARLEAVEEGVETFAEAFLPHLVDPATDETVFQSLVRTGGLSQLQLTAGGSS